MSEMTNDPNVQKEIPILLENVESEHCALIIDKGLGKLKGVIAHRVELNNERAVIAVTDVDVLTQAVDTIRDLGYGVVTATANLPVLNMSCASCAVSAETIIKSLKGVLSAVVNYASATLTVTYLPNLITPTKMQQALQSIGYDLLLNNEEGTQPTLEEIQENNRRQLKRKTIWAVIFSVPIVLIDMLWMHMPYANIIMWLLATPVVIWIGKDFFINAFKQARHRSANMDTLVALSTGVAYLFSVFNVLWPSFWLKRGIESHVYFETASVIIVFILIGKLLEERAKGNTTEAIKKLMGLQPTTVTILMNNTHEMQMSIAQVQIGNVIVVKPGERVAVDGRVLSGSSYVDESLLSGEPIPVLKQENDEVFAGTMNQKGSFQFEATKVGSDTLLAHIIQTVQQAQGSKAPVQKLVDKIASIFVPIVMLVAILTLIIWSIFGSRYGFVYGIQAAIAVLVVACPCALGLATPTAIMVGIGKAATHGILIKDAESLELGKTIDTVILDKTGTITKGSPKVNNIVWSSESDIYRRVLYSIESRSEHPLAEAVVEYFKGTDLVEISSFESITGRGVKAIIDNVIYYIGNTQLMQENNIVISENIHTSAMAWEQDANTVIWLSDENKTIAAIAINDQVKESSVAAVKQLIASGIDVVMLTGDNQYTAAAIARQVGLVHYESQMQPQQKADYIKNLQSEGHKVAMVGDGINDSTALAIADVSIAMGMGSDVAIDVANMTIVSSDLTKISEAFALSKATVQTIHQNLFWAFIYNLIGIPIAAGVLYPINHFLLNPMVAGGAMALSSVCVVLNSIRLKSKQLK